jgi:hypothetical protein
VSLNHSASEAAPRLRHEAVLYADDQEYADLLARFLRAGLEAGEPTFVWKTASGQSVLSDWGNPEEGFFGSCDHEGKQVHIPALVGHVR